LGRSQYRSEWLGPARTRTTDRPARSLVTTLSYLVYWLLKHGPVKGNLCNTQVHSGITHEYQSTEISISKLSTIGIF
jgi:hypothetical protein